MSIELKCVSFDDADVKAFDNVGEITGYASVFNRIDAYGDTILKGAYSDFLKKQQMPAMLFNHIGSAFQPQSDYPSRIGKWVEMREDERGLFVRGVITQGHPVGDAVLASIRNGTIDGLSIGFRLNKDGYVKREKSRGRIISKIGDLVEVSVVENPADNNARVNFVKTKSEELNDLYKTLLYVKISL